MTNAARDEDGVPVPLHDIYSEQLRVDAVRLIWLGYQRLNPTSFRASEEDDITGELVRKMKLVAQDPASPDWVDRYEIHEQPPQNVAGKLGKRRPKMDIEIERHSRGPRPHLRFEAKRLGRGHAVGKYLSDEGLGAFLTGYYPTTHGESGMLGYVQEGTSIDWSAKLKQELSRDPSKHRLAENGEWRSSSSASSAPAFYSNHTDSKGNPLLVIHVLLPFA